MDIMGALRQMQETKKIYDQAQAELEKLTVTGMSGGGMVSVDVSGLGQVKRIKIDRSVVNPDDVEMLEDLITVAVGEAQKKATDEQAMRQSKLMEGLPFKLPF